ncbi:ATP-binding protein, partial [Clostridium sp.]|uniref:ATP-binding protein n=1 Tax=Clostridium sp. TaxID=1506 RepID=UPI0034646437
FSRDYITTSCNLKELVSSVVTSKKRDFIYKGVFPKMDIGESISVYTDKKWGSYMLAQIISNAIKYSDVNKNNKIEIMATNKNNVIELLIKDYGIGITEEDLPRVFEPFFTGNNGRKERGSSGIGLYMVNIIAKKLGHKIKIESKIDSGTVVKIEFNNESII